jgi:biopolymer transport protein ExbD
MVRRLRKRTAALEVTAFINVIVVLVPFLLSTAVFTRLSVLELSLPAQSSAVEQLKVNDLKQELARRRLEHLHRRRHARALRLFAQPSDQRLVPAMEAVEVADRKHAAAVALAQVVQPPDQLHGSSQKRPEIITTYPRC